MIRMDTKGEMNGMRMHGVKDSKNKNKKVRNGNFPLWTL